MNPERFADLVGGRADAVHVPVAPLAARPDDEAVAVQMTAYPTTVLPYCSAGGGGGAGGGRTAARAEPTYAIPCLVDEDAAASPEIGAANSVRVRA